MLSMSLRTEYSWVKRRGSWFALKSRPGEHIARLQIERCAEDDSSETYFACDLLINPGFVVIVGNKGDGKSALMDVMGLAGNSTREGNFSFLNEERFRHPQANNARHYLLFGMGLA